MDEYTIITCKHCKEDSTFWQDAGRLICDNCGRSMSTEEARAAVKNIGAMGGNRQYADERGQGSDYYNETMFGD